MEFPKGLWVKNWVVNVGVVFDSLDGELYTKHFQEKLGKSFTNSILTYENGISTNYMPKNEMDDICQYFVGQITKDINVAKVWCQQLIDETDKINALMRQLAKKETISNDEFIELKEAFYSHVAPNFAIKRSIDYLSPEQLNQIMDDFEKARLYTESVYMEFERLLKKFLSVIGEKNGYANELIYYLTHNELEKYLQTGSLPEKQVLEDRSAVTLLWYQNGEYQIYTKDKAKDIIKEITKPADTNTIKGMTAYKGLARGCVRIVFEPREAKEFNEGDILVTGMTRPEFLPLMSKAAAFITDSGGMLSHAAITAREMKKPCIVGTEIATKVLKDGDIVEVDANRGVVRKI